MTDKDWKAALSTDEVRVTTLLVYADWLEEQGRLADSFKQREKAGLGHIYWGVQERLTGHTHTYYRQKGHLVNRLRDYARYGKDGCWPSWYCGGCRIADTSIVRLWHPAIQLIGMKLIDVWDTDILSQIEDM